MEIMLLLSFSIWNHLVRLSEERGTTILITTHYIDEAKESTAVGVMRYGRLLVEQDPAQLLQRFNTTSLETVVLELCKKDSNESDEKDMGDTNTSAGRIRRDSELAKLQYEIGAPDDTKCKWMIYKIYFTYLKFFKKLYAFHNFQSFHLLIMRTEMNEFWIQ